MGIEVEKMTHHGDSTHEPYEKRNDSGIISEDPAHARTISGTGAAYVEGWACDESQSSRQRRRPRHDYPLEYARKIRDDVFYDRTRTDTFAAEARIGNGA